MGGSLSFFVIVVWHCFGQTAVIIAMHRLFFLQLCVDLPCVGGSESEEAASYSIPAPMPNHASSNPHLVVELTLENAAEMTNRLLVPAVNIALSSIYSN